MRTLSPRQSLLALTLRVCCPHRFISDDQSRISINDLRVGASIDVRGVHGLSVLVKTTRQLPTVLAALALDGIAKRMVLCPPDQWHHLPSIIEQAGIDAVVTDARDDAYPIMQRVDWSLRHPVPTDHGIETEWILLTSGTTGLPKLTIHTLSSLTGPLDDGLAVSTGAVWSTFYDVRRYGGLQILLRALLGGGSMILSDSAEAPADFLARLGKSGVTHISGTPSHWRRAIMTSAANAMSPTYVRLSGEIADQTILDSLGRTYEGANIAHAFASTEAGVAFDVRDGKAGFPASYIDNPSLKAELRVEGGTLHIRSSRTASSYIGKPLAGFGGFVDTGDLVEKQGDRYYFTGRKEGVINVGGQKVFPEEVEAVIAQHPDIQMAKVWPRPNPIVWSLVAVDVILKPDSNCTVADIRKEVLDHCRRHLSDWKVPVSFRVVDKIELNAAGKIARGV